MFVSESIFYTLHLGVIVLIEVTRNISKTQNFRKIKLI